MNINMDDINLLAQEKILIFLEDVQKQLINFNSIRLDDLKKINAIAYGQTNSQNSNMEITNLLTNIQKNINQYTRVYDYSNKYNTNYQSILAGFLNSRIIEELN